MAKRREGGFSLLELAVVLVIIGLILAMGVQAMGGWVEAKRREATQDRLDAIVEALVVYASQHRRLPCPADVNAFGTNTEGKESPVGGGACTNTQTDGVVPWVTLGLREADALDGWNRLITYRVDDASLTTAGGMDMTGCDPAASGATNGAICDGNADGDDSPVTFLSGKGLRVADATGGTLLNDPDDATSPSGAAFVLVSHGPNASYAYNLSGSLISGIGTVGTDEQMNRNNKAVTTYVSGGADEYVDRLIDESDDATRFDDILRRPTIIWVAVKAGLGPEK